MSAEVVDLPYLMPVTGEAPVRDDVDYEELLHGAVSWAQCYMGGGSPRPDARFSKFQTGEQQSYSGNILVGTVVRI